MPLNEFTFLNGVCRQTKNGQAFFIANPLRALADYVYDRKIEYTSIDFLLEGLRIETENLKTLTTNDFNAVLSVFRAKRVQSFLQHLQTQIIVTKKPRKMANNIISDRLKKY